MTIEEVLLKCTKENPYWMFRSYDPKATYAVNNHLRIRLYDALGKYNFFVIMEEYSLYTYNAHLFNSEKKLICVLKNVKLPEIVYAFTALFP